MSSLIQNLATESWIHRSVFDGGCGSSSGVFLSGTSRDYFRSSSARAYKYVGGWLQINSADEEWMHFPWTLLSTARSTRVPIDWYPTWLAGTWSTNAMGTDDRSAQWFRAVGHVGVAVGSDEGKWY